jgi:hypothetical protein
MERLRLSAFPFDLHRAPIMGDHGASICAMAAPPNVRSNLQLSGLIAGHRVRLVLPMYDLAGSDVKGQPPNWRSRENRRRRERQI